MHDKELRNSGAPPKCHNQRVGKGYRADLRRKQRNVRPCSCALESQGAAHWLLARFQYESDRDGGGGSTLSP